MKKKWLNILKRLLFKNQNVCSFLVKCMKKEKLPNQISKKHCNRTMVNVASLP